MCTSSSSSPVFLYILYSLVRCSQDNAITTPLPLPVLSITLQQNEFQTSYLQRHNILGSVSKREALIAWSLGRTASAGHAIRLEIAINTLMSGLIWQMEARNAFTEVETKLRQGVSGNPTKCTRSPTSIELHMALYTLWSRVLHNRPVLIKH